MTPKERRPCCAARRDSAGRLPIGFCSPECEGRRERDVELAARQAAIDALLDALTLGWPTGAWEWAWSATLGRVVYGENGASQ